MQNNYCVCCGEIIPEGRQVCRTCEQGCNTDFIRGIGMKNKRKILFLSHTWGIAMTLIGYGARFVFLCTGNKGEKRGFAKVYKVGKGWGGVSLGTTIIVARDCATTSTIAHELGHGIQNAMYGIFTPFIVSIPSAIRYHYREHLKKKGVKPKTGYDDIWFEAQATKLGIEYFDGGQLK